MHSFSKNPKYHNFIILIGTGRVVKAFNSFNRGFMADPNVNGVPTDLLIAGDDAEGQ